MGQLSYMPVTQEGVLHAGGPPRFAREGARTRILLEDEGLRARLSDARGRKAEALAHLCWVPLELLAPGRWGLRRYLRDDRHIGLLVIDGFIFKELRLLAHQSAGELLGPGDVIHPERFLEKGRPFSQTSWRALCHARIAVLDAGFEAVAAGNPGLLAEVIERSTSRTHHVSVQLALSGMRNLARRLHLLLWHYAQRWGESRGDAYHLQAPFSHSVLAKLAGAQRPSVSAALAELSARGDVRRVDRNAWEVRDPRLCGFDALPDSVSTLT